MDEEEEKRSGKERAEVAVMERMMRSVRAETEVWGYIAMIEGDRVEEELEDKQGRRMRERERR